MVDGTRKAVTRKSIFKQISKSDLVTIHDAAGERKGRATSREYGNWVLVLLFGTGTALATPENVTAVVKPKAIEQIPEAGQHLVYNDGRPGHTNSRAEILEVTSRSMLVQFENHASPTLIYFDDPEWMDYISFEKDAMPKYETGDYVKFEMTDERTGASEWMWLLIDRVDVENRLLFGRLDSQPVVFDKELSLGRELAVNFNNVREHKKAFDFA